MLFRSGDRSELHALGGRRQLPGRRPRRRAGLIGLVFAWLAAAPAAAQQPTTPERVLGLVRAPDHAGTVLPVAPPVPPGTIAPLPSDLIQAAIDRRTQGDPAAAARYFLAWLDRKGGDGRTRAAVQLAAGLALLDSGEPNLASALFSKVRASEIGRAHV